MGITIRFTMDPKKNWFSGTAWNQDTAEELAKNLVMDMGYHCDFVEEYLIFRFCPEGFMWMKWSNRKLRGKSQTNIAGPGFHAAVIRFIEAFAARGQMKLSVEDVTGYYLHRDFQKMRQEYFYKCFRELMEHVVHRQDGEMEQLVCWPSDYYLPEDRKDLVLSHIRYFSVQEIYGMVHSGLSMAFAKDFFIWNEEEKDSYFYRNCGMVLLNQECYFMPSGRSCQDQIVNDQIIYYLEKAYQLDPEIPLPLKDYIEICRLAEKEPADVAKAVPFPDSVRIGCRKGLIYRKIGCIRFAIPGNFLYDPNPILNTEHYYDGKEYGGHDYYICALHTKEEAKFQEKSFLDDEAAEMMSFSVQKAMGRIAVYEPASGSGEDCVTLVGQIIYRNQLTIISIMLPQPEEKDWGINLIKKVQTIE